MAARGPKPKGGTRPQYAADVPDCPEWLGEAARAIWLRVIGELVASKTLAAIDADVIAAYASAVADLAAVSEALDRSGVVVEIETVDRNGKPTGHVVQKTNPLLKAKNELLGRVGVLASALGIGPVSRTRVNSSTTHEPTTPKTNKVLGIRERIEAARNKGDA